MVSGSLYLCFLGTPNPETDLQPQLPVVYLQTPLIIQELFLDFVLVSLHYMASPGY